MKKPKLGFVGLGRMGGPMSRRLLAAGYDVVVHDQSTDAVAAVIAAGGHPADSPRTVADQADIVLTSLPTPPIVRAVALGADGFIHGSRARIMIDVSTTGPTTAREVDEGLSAVGKQWVDCPVSGGIKGAVDGTLALMLSCPAAVYAEIEPVVANFGKPFHVGEQAGQAQVVKLANNMLAAAAIFLTSEAMAMGVKAGVDANTMLEIINMSTGRNSASQDKFPRAVLTGTFDFGFATALSYKDVRLCVDEAENLGVPMIGGAMIREILAITNAKYGPESDFTSMAKLIEDWCGVEIRG